MSQQGLAKLKLTNIPTDNFLMTPLELKDYIDFTVKRVYFISNFSGTYKTGSHCHLEDEDELFIMVQGTATAVIDRGEGLTEIKLEAPHDALRVPHLVWHHFKDISADAIILSLSSTNYSPDREDYCEDYQEFKKIINSLDK